MTKKRLGSLLVALMLVSVIVTGCASKEDTPTTKTPENKDEFVIGISQLAEHPALDDARRGFEDGLKELGVNAKIDFKNAQGDIPTATTISQKFANDKVDLIYAIATPAAQAAKQATEDIPVLFSAVTDPVEAKIVKDWDNVGGNVTGTSDMADTEKQLKMFKEIDPSIKKIGIIYNTSEPNSEVQIKIVEKLAPSEGLEVVTMGVNNVNEMAQTLDSLLKKIDALYILSDNMVASSIDLVSNKLIEREMISVSAEESQVGGGILITNGLSYYELGKQTARMAKEILIDGKEVSSMPVERAQKTNTVVNEKTLEALKLDKDLNLFKDANMVGK
ncbi:ABC transporter substrate-binding protein [Tissierella creatinophila]|uniref:ABC transporter substrate binding protein n=1 Tax=Tissierella creatinophila DSM 6911 TaxID=1123403 RepID=A0A1U7M724_TISCR|nr:ABC transporter substrate-binding protein [Tissierella creatinophila]OLS03086.1 ABC transporter substrate binding protein [Tissierella creatinophila DSM 6911]